jgi:hypothetical protein
MGRWLNRDPIEELGGLNLYVMVGNDPIGRWDYLGQQDHSNTRRGRVGMPSVDLGYITGSFSLYFPIGAGAGGIYTSKSGTIKTGKCCFRGSTRSVTIKSVSFEAGVYVGGPNPSYRAGLPIKLGNIGACPKSKKNSCTGSISFSLRIGPVSYGCRKTYGSPWSCGGSITWSLIGGNPLSTRLTGGGGITCNSIVVN